MTRRQFAPTVFFLALTALPGQLCGSDLSILDKGRNVRLTAVGQGLLCEGRVVTSSSAVVTIRLSKAAPDCGGKDQPIYVSGSNVVDLVPERRPSRGRIVSKVLVGCAGVAALAAVPLTSSDPESLLILTNPVIPAAVFYAGWRTVPKRLDYLLIMTCPDRHHCVSSSPVPAEPAREARPEIGSTQPEIPERSRASLSLQQ